MATGRELALYNMVKASGESFLRDWEAVEFLGKGSFGAVYRAVKKAGESELQSAVKISEVDSAIEEKYRAEITALARMANQSHVVRIEDVAEIMVHDHGFDRKFFAIRMELLESLPPQGLTESEVIKLGIQLSEVLDYCHSLMPQILHCDIKPDNILVSSEGIYKLSDFSEVRMMERSHVSKSGGHGTPFFMSPEMSNSTGYDARSDLYSLGVTMYALLNNGYPPFYDGVEINAMNAVNRRLSGERLPVIKGVSSGMMAIVRKLCAMQPDDRYQSARELHKALVDLESGEAERMNEKTHGGYSGSAGGKTGDIPYKARVLSNGTVSIVHGDSGLINGGLNIPPVIKISGKKYKVSSIGNEAFRVCIHLTDIVIPDSVTSIGENAFSCCNSLASIAIPNGVHSIGNSAFMLCNTLESVTIPNSVRSIGDWAFNGCKSLLSVTIPGSVTSIGNGAFDSYYLKEIRGKSGSEAERYAKQNGLRFTAI